MNLGDKTIKRAGNLRSQRCETRPRWEHCHQNFKRVRARRKETCWAKARRDLKEGWTAWAGKVMKNHGRKVKRGRKDMTGERIGGKEKTRRNCIKRKRAKTERGWREKSKGRSWVSS